MDDYSESCQMGVRYSHDYLPGLHKLLGIYEVSCGSVVCMTHPPTRLKVCFQ